MCNQAFYEILFPLPRVRGFWENVRQFILRLWFFVFCFCLFVCFFEVEISSRTLIPLFCQDQSTVAQRTETTVTEIFPDELRVSSFPGWFPHYAWTAA